MHRARATHTRHCNMRDSPHVILVILFHSEVKFAWLCTMCGEGRLTTDLWPRLSRSYVSRRCKRTTITHGLSPSWGSMATPVCSSAGQDPTQMAVPCFTVLSHWNFWSGRASPTDRHSRSWTETMLVLCSSLSLPSSRSRMGKIPFCTVVSSPSLLLPVTSVDSARSCHVQVLA